MRVVIQRVSKASVIIDNVITGEIEAGFVVLLGIEPEDTDTDIDWLTSKICGLRVFSDAEGLMNRKHKSTLAAMMCVCFERFTDLRII